MRKDETAQVALLDAAWTRDVAFDYGCASSLRNVAYAVCRNAAADGHTNCGVPFVEAELRQVFADQEEYAGLTPIHTGLPIQDRNCDWGAPRTK